MVVILTGAAGFIGSNLARYLLRETDYHVLAVDKLTYAGNRSSLADLEENPRFKFLQADVCDRAAMRQAFNDVAPVGVIHLAAESHVDRSIDGPDAFIQTNIMGTYNLLQVARHYFDDLEPTKQRQFRFLHVSTDEVFGSLTHDDPAFNEQTPYDPRSPYSASKAAADHLVRAWGNTYGLPVLVTNCSNNYGPCQFPEKLIPVVILNAIRGESIPIFGTGENIRDWLYVDDHARAIERVFSAGLPGQTYNVGGNNEQQNLDLVRQICALLDELRPIAENMGLEAAQRSTLRSYADLITLVEDRPGHDLRYAIDTTKIEAELNWKPQEDSLSGFRKTVQWYLDNENWWQKILSDE